MKLVNWRREAMFLAIASMETCWIVGWSRVFLKGREADLAQGGGTTGAAGLAWWSVLAFFVLAFALTRAVRYLQLQRGAWIILGLAVFSSPLLLQVNLTSGGGPLGLGWMGQVLRNPSEPLTARAFITWLIGLLVWLRVALILMRPGDTAAVTRQFQMGVLFLAGLTLVTLRFPVPVKDLIPAYFALGLLAVALTRMEEVAQSRSGVDAPFGFNWSVVLVVTLLAVGALAWGAMQVVTVEALHTLLKPFILLGQLLLLPLVMLATALMSLIVPLLQRLIGDSMAEIFYKVMDSLQGIARQVKPNERPDDAGSMWLLQTLEILLAVGLILTALWLLVRAFRQWRRRRYDTPDGVREKLEPEGDLREDLAEFLQDQWRRLRGAANLRRLLERLGTASVREIYASLLALLAAAGHPRQPEQTPYEYRPTAENALPRRSQEVEAITEAYVRAHYGEIEVDGEELARLQEAWKRIRAG